MSTLIYGNFTQKLLQMWIERADSTGTMGSQVVPHSFHDMDIFPSSSQVHEMLQCANECSKRHSSDYLTFGEFCVFASELKSGYDNKIPRNTPLSKSVTEARKLNCRKNISQAPKCPVFLGGSCNPTTWRKNVAIPYFRDLGIDCYNPQVAEWGPELIEIENEAKQNADVMFFVIDNQTRSIASMVEAAQVAGTNRKLIVVIHRIEKPGSIVMGEAISDAEFKVLQQGHDYLQDVVERQGIPVFDNIKHAIECTSTIIKKDIKPQDLTLADVSHPVKMAYLQVGDKLIKLKQVFQIMDSNTCGTISLKEVCKAFKILTGTELEIEKLKSVVSQQYGILPDSASVDNHRVDFNQFCCVITEFRHQLENSCTNLTSLLNKTSDALCSILTPLSKLIDWMHPDPMNSTQRSKTDVPYNTPCRDIYLGGTKLPSAWREDIAIPILKKKGLTSFTPQSGIWSERLIPMEATNMENSRVLLFVITSDSRALAEMIMAAHYVGVGCKLVLCIQYIADDSVIDNEVMSCQAIKDYNRGRVYLSDLATRAGVPVFDKIDEAVECAAELCSHVA